MKETGTMPFLVTGKNITSYKLFLYKYISREDIKRSLMATIFRLVK